MPMSSLTISIFLVFVALIFVSNTFGKEDRNVDAIWKESEDNDQRVKDKIRSRTKRNTTISSGGTLLKYFELENASSFLQKVNKLRAHAGGADMQKLTWSENLALGAKNFAEKCHIGPVPATMCINVGSAMLAFHSTETDGEKLLEHYLGLIETEGKTFHVATEKCSGNPCPHYQQFVWSTSRKIGCAVVHCSSIGNNPNRSNKLFGVCLFSPPGLRPNKKCFFPGAPCSKCKKGCESDGHLCKPALTTLCTNTMYAPICDLANQTLYNSYDLDVCSHCFNYYHSAMSFECKKYCSFCD